MEQLWAKAQKWNSLACKATRALRGRGFLWEESPEGTGMTEAWTFCKAVSDPGCEVHWRWESRRGDPSQFMWQHFLWLEVCGVECTGWGDSREVQERAPVTTVVRQESLVACILSLSKSVLGHCRVQNEEKWFHCLKQLRKGVNKLPRLVLNFLCSPTGLVLLTRLCAIRPGPREDFAHSHHREMLSPSSDNVLHIVTFIVLLYCLPPMCRMIC